MAITDNEMFALAASGARQSWAADPGLRAEFPTAESYVNHIAAVFAGNAEAARPGFEKEWRASAALQAEFLSAESYAALKCAELRGVVRMHRGRVAGR